MPELPLRIIDQPGGAVIRCLCGAELAALKRGLAGGVAFARTAGANPAQGKLSPDVSPAGLLIMVSHAQRCQRGAAVLDMQQRAWSGL